jgi:predicted nucleic acid-binding Zn ribbon protein
VVVQNCALNRQRLDARRARMRMMGAFAVGRLLSAEFLRIQLRRRGRVECSKSRGQFLQLSLATCNQWEGHSTTGGNGCRELKSRSEVARKRSLMERTRCNFCGAALESSREFIYHFESLQYDERALKWARQMPGYRGEPLRLCKKCSDGIEENKRALQEDAAITSSQRRFREVCFVILVVLLALALSRFLF